MRLCKLLKKGNILFNCCQTVAPSVILGLNSIYIGTRLGLDWMLCLAAMDANDINLKIVNMDSKVKIVNFQQRNLYFSPTEI